MLNASPYRTGKISARNEVLLNIDHSKQTEWQDPLERLYWEILLLDLDPDNSIFQLLTTTAAIISGRWKLLTGKHIEGSIYLYDSFVTFLTYSCCFLYCLFQIILFFTVKHWFTKVNPFSTTLVKSVRPK